MIYVEMYGRLGNQMFRYAMARALQIKFYNEDSIVINFNNLSGKQFNDGSFTNELSNFNVEQFEIYETKGKLLKNETTFRQKLIYFLVRLYLPKYNPQKMLKIEKKLRKISGLMNRFGIYWSWVGYQKPIESKKKDKFVSGNFESPQYFDDIKSLLIKEFTPKNPVNPRNLELLNIIENNESVCISVRRGDFVKDKKISKTHNVINAQYFEDSISYMNSILKDPVYIIFSDDIEWAKENINFGKYKVYSEYGNDEVYEKLRLMYSCKHFIISNSTFSWWAQYLGRNKEKIVISPERWFNNDYNSSLLRESFIKISCS
ncbi:alpha-1,2-fucosyltransferase [Enterococcus devriesei]|uniref:alpha-1,2-fucosyltransferase n=1 Tax=Enterococcus devriesei TaxID=319970 RepID=UPI0028905C9F|nr:alpha-1,2-fucosyltransferase [Enterococcus devriesei]MDT2822151.1 alpha-1,2-fucosyltransferase [Enterococcus devriesei]